MVAGADPAGGVPGHSTRRGHFSYHVASGALGSARPAWTCSAAIILTPPAEWILHSGLFGHVPTDLRARRTVDALTYLRKRVGESFDLQCGIMAVAYSVWNVIDCPYKHVCSVDFDVRIARAQARPESRLSFVASTQKRKSILRCENHGHDHLEARSCSTH